MNAINQPLPTPALKEWAIAIQALSQGETIMLLRKGGIHEEAGRFSVEHSRVLLYPTYEHQKPHLLKPAYAKRVIAVESGWHPEAIAIHTWAEITHIFQVSAAETVAALHPFHIWHEQFMVERFNWKPRQPLYVLLLRVYRLPEVKLLAFQAAYGRCKSWIDLPLERSLLQPTQPVLDDGQYSQQVAAIQQQIEHNQPR
ncbi:MAG TPA: DUF1802 family protein [Synechococcales cyanobacterium M55_K2018_004]|nr:DUF1802 family protein [Synechococcales cyanobacterium M55_K2018_004]